MNDLDPSSPGRAPAPAFRHRDRAARPAAFERAEDERQEITRWSVVGNDRLIGRIHNRPGTANGRTIMTSRVVQVRFLGVGRHPVAFTESGTAYWLGRPADSFGIERAETFVWQKSRIKSVPEGHTQPRLETTTVLRLMD